MKNVLLSTFLFGFFFSRAAAQISWQPVNNGLGTDTLARAIVVAANGDLFLGTSEGGYRSTNHGNLWTPLIPPGTIEVQTLALDQAYMYAGTAHGVFLSTDAGTSWAPINNGFPDALVLAIATNSSRHVFAGTDVNGLFRSTDFGANWSQLTNGLTSLDMVVLAYVSPSTIFAGTDGAGMFISTNNGDSWGQSNSGLGDLLTRSITVGLSGHVFVGTNTGGLFRSTNAGQSWSAVTGLSTISIVSLCTHPRGDLYAGTSGDGVFRSTNNGVSWSAINSGLTNLFVYALAVDSARYVYAGTAGGGVFRTDQPVSVSSQPHDVVPTIYTLFQNYPNPFNPSTQIEFDLPQGGQVSLDVYDVLGRKIAGLVQGYKEAGNHTVTWDASNLAGGIYFARFSVTDAQGNVKYTNVNKLVLMK